MWRGNTLLCEAHTCGVAAAPASVAPAVCAAEGGAVASGAFQCGLGGFCVWACRCRWRQRRVWAASEGARYPVSAPCIVARAWLDSSYPANPKYHIFVIYARGPSRPWSMHMSKPDVSEFYRRHPGQSQRHGSRSCPCPPGSKVIVLLNYRP